MKAIRSTFLLAAVVTVLATTCVGEELSGQEDARRRIVSSQEPPPVDAAFDKLAEAMWGWKVVERDAEPSVTAGDARGWRIVFSGGPPGMEAAAGWTALIHAIPDRAPRPSWVDFVIFSDDGSAPGEAAAVLWPARETADLPRDMFLGRGMGYVWFARAPLLDETRVIEALGLEGADMKALLVSGLTVRDAEAAWRRARMLAHSYKEGALAEIEKALAERRKLGLHDAPLIMALTELHGEGANDLVKEAYRGDCRDHAEYVLAARPYRPSLKTLYLDMLENGRKVYASTQAAIEFGWVDFVPVLEGIISEHSTTAYDCRALIALRALTGAPIPQSAIEAPYYIVLKDESGEWHINDAAADAITSLEDKEAAAALAVSIIFHLHDKGTEPGSIPHRIEAAKTLVSRLPREVTRSLIVRIAATRDAAGERREDSTFDQAVAALESAVE